LSDTPNIFSAATLEKIVSRVFRAMGTPQDITDQVSHSLILSNLVGHDSHGIIRIMEYYGWVKSFDLNPIATPSISWSRGSSAFIDGAWGFGQPAAMLATREVISLAKNTGTASVVIGRSNHVGRLGEYVNEIANHGMLGISFCNAAATIVAPYGGAKPLMGTNPFAWAIPGTGEMNTVLDFSTALIAAGKVIHAAMSGEIIQSGALIDKDGNPSTNPNDLQNGGALLPFGEHKGSGLSVLIDVAAGALSGVLPAAIENTGHGNGTVIIAMDISNYVKIDIFKNIAEAFLVALHSTKAIDGPEVLMPGELEFRTKTLREKAGIHVSRGVQENILIVARELGVEIPEFD
jgi:LDH2 family malate/lactate/ureidoglycolate dehydrogenase